MYYVRNSTNTLIQAINQNRSNSQFNPKTSKNTTYLKKSKLSNKNESEKKPYFSNLDIDIKKLSNGLSMDQNYNRTNMTKTNNFLKTTTKVNSTIRAVDEQTNEKVNFQTTRNFFPSRETPLQLDENCNKTKKDSFRLNSTKNEALQRNLHSSQGFPIKEHSMNYERILKTSHANREENFKISRELKEKNKESDPFFLKKYDFAEEKYNKERENGLNAKKPNYYDSDVFFSKDFNANKDKSYDKFIISQQNKFYGITNTSKSEWSPKNSKTNLLNHTSVPFSIFNANVKSFMKSKDEIMKEHNGSPANRQKSICEFIDLTRVFCPNPNKDYLNALQKSSSAFQRTSNICASFQNVKSEYESIIKNPFFKKNIK